MRPLVRSLLLRWFAVSGGMIAYAVALVGGFWLVPLVCARGGLWSLHALMAVCLVVSAASLLAAVVLWRGDRARMRPQPLPAQSTGGRVFVLGVLLQRVSLALGGLLWASAKEPPSTVRTVSQRRPATPQRQREMALGGIVLGVLAVMLVLFHWAPIFVLDPCS
ncbi:hypothetical protein BH23ACT9_BH23ACT9_30990 [soil metagenome]